MSGPMARMYGAATMVGKDEMNGRINPAMEPDDDLPIVEAQRRKSMKERGASGGGGATDPLIGGGSGGVGGAIVTQQGQTAF